MKEYRSMIDFEEDEYSGEKFVGLNLTNADLSRKNFIDCTFERCDLSLAKFVNASLRNVRFVSCKVMGVDFTKCNVMFLEIGFKECLIDTCNFSGLKLAKTEFVHSGVRECIFAESQSKNADFSGSDCEGTTWHHADLEDADFTGAKNYAIDPTASKIKGAKFSLPEAVSLLRGLGILLD